MRSRRIRTVLPLSCIALAVLGCPEPPPRQNVVVVSIDTLRPDHLGAYGYERPTSPRIDRFREDGVLYEEAITPAPSTLPAHASLFTSLIPPHHGALYTYRRPLPEDAVTLAEVLSSAGYDTRAFTAGGQISPEFGLGQGFERYGSFPEAPLGEIVARATGWLEERRGEAPFFLFLHSYEIHHPYDPEPEDLAAVTGSDRRASASDLPDDITVELIRRLNSPDVIPAPADVEHVVARYDAEIRSADAAFGELVSFLRERGLYGDSLIVLTSDHGEEFGERGSVGWHSHTLYDELLRVPLIVKLPENRDAGETVERQVRLVDVAPTVLATVGLEIPETFSGCVVLPRKIPRPWSCSGAAVSVRDMPGEAPRTSIRTEGWKYIEGRSRAGRRLFDLRSDPGERRNLVDEAEWRRDLLQWRLERILASREPLRADPVPLDAETEEQLRALGYAD